MWHLIQTWIKAELVLSTLILLELEVFQLSRLSASDFRLKLKALTRRSSKNWLRHTQQKMFTKRKIWQDYVCLFLQRSLNNKYADVLETRQCFPVGIDPFENLRGWLDQNNLGHHKPPTPLFLLWQSQWSVFVPSNHRLQRNLINEPSDKGKWKLFDNTMFLSSCCI